MPRKAPGRCAGSTAARAASSSAFERATAARADVSLFVSEAEAALFRGAAPACANIRALSNGIDLDFFDPAADFPRSTERRAGPLLLFTGQMDYRAQCRRGALVRRARCCRCVPGARFAIVGRNPTAGGARARRASGCIVTGAVADMRTWLAAADVVVAPLRIARGIQNKVLEAMAMARPVVASPAAFEGIEAEPGRDLLVADGAEAQAEAIRRLLADPARAAAHRRGRARAGWCDSYRWDARLAPLADMVGLAAPEGGGMTAALPSPRRATARRALARASRRARRSPRPRSSLLFRRDAADIAAIWWNSSTFNHCLLIPPIIAWLVWQRLPRAAPARRPPPGAPGLLLVGAGALGWLLGEAGGVDFARHLGLLAHAAGRGRSPASARRWRAASLSRSSTPCSWCPVGEELVPAMQTVTAEIAAGPARPHRRAGASRGHLHHHADRLFRGRRGLRRGASS